MSLPCRLILALLVAGTALPSLPVADALPAGRRVQPAEGQRAALSLVLVGPSRSPVGESLALISPNARVHAKLRGLIEAARSCLGSHFKLGAGPGVGVSVGLKF